MIDDIHSTFWRRLTILVSLPFLFVIYMMVGIFESLIELATDSTRSWLKRPDYAHRPSIISD